MEIFLQILLLAVGFFILIKGADWMIDGASSIAEHLHMPKILIGLTIVAFGTSAPELAISISSLVSGNTDLLLGNVIGSNILNILLLIGIAALICPLAIRSATVRKELPMLLLISTALAVLFLDVALNKSLTDMISRSDGIICLLFFGIFLYYLIAMAKHGRDKAKREQAKNVKNKKKAKQEVSAPKYPIWKAIIFTILGLAGVILGSRLVVDNASLLAAAIGMSDRVIALTIVAFGTSLPELMTTITAARKHEPDLIVGNIVGSNIFNICIVLGLPVALFGEVTPESFQMIDLIVFIGSAILLFLFAKTDRKITRLEGILMLVTFAIYYGYIVMMEFI